MQFFRFARLARTATLLTITLLLSSCSQINPYYDASKPHHTPTGFTNNYPPNPAYKRPEVGFFEGWARRIKIWTSGKPEVRPRRPLQPVQPDLGFIQTNRNTPAITWIGHATFLLQTGSGLNILTDPVFEERASPVFFAGPKRHQAPGLALAQLPRIDAILISHSHYDHLSRQSLRQLYRQAGGPPKIYAPLGVDLWLLENVTDGEAQHVVRLDWWDKAVHADTQIQLLPVQHWSARTPWDRNETLWGAFAVVRNGFSFFFSGDLGYSRDIADIAARYADFDAAAIGIGAYEPVWYRNSHLSPDEAVKVHKELRVKRSIGMHWGTFPMGEERLDQPVDDLAAARERHGVAEDAFIVLRHGETRRLK